MITIAVISVLTAIIGLFYLNIRHTGAAAYRATSLVFTGAQLFVLASMGFDWAYQSILFSPLSAWLVFDDFTFLWIQNNNFSS